MGLGLVWYSPSVFGKRWMKAVGLTARSKTKEMGLTYALTFFAALITAFVLEIFIENIPDSGAATGIITGFWAGIGFVAASNLSEYLFNPHKSKDLYFINSGFHIVAFMVMGLLLGL